MRKILIVFLLAGIAVAMTGCLPGSNFTPTKGQCMYHCSKCGKNVLMLNSLLRSQPCPEGGTHEWQYNIR